MVFTTLTRRGMPLIRYRTGDLAAFAVGDCPCCSRLRRMRPVRGRIGGGIGLRGAPTLRLPDLDEAIFAVDGVMDYRAKVKNDRRGTRLNLRVTADGSGEADMAAAVQAAVLELPSVAEAVRVNALQLEAIAFGPLRPPDNSAIKRRIMDIRKETPI